jgi:response regulator of citrate/malate metabolism
VADLVCTAPRHGSPAAYWAHRCRCPETTKLMQQYRARRRILVDEARVLRACDGERLWLNIRERTEAVRLLTLRGKSPARISGRLQAPRRHMSAAEIADRLHLSERTVQRYVRKLREEYRRQAEVA